MYGDKQQEAARDLTLREKAEDAYLRVARLEKEVGELRNQLHRVRLQVDGPCDVATAPR